MSERNLTLYERMMTMSKTLITSNDPKGRQATDIFRATYDQAKLDDERAQRLNENGGELKTGIAKLIEELSATNQFAGEEVRSSYSYPKGYSVLALAKQIDILRKIFNLSLGDTIAFVENVLPKLKLPEGAEGWFAIPSVDAVANRFFPEVADPAEKYCWAVDLVLEKLGSSRKFYNYRRGQITPERLQRVERTAQMLAEIAKVQTGDILIIPAQFGKRHAGKSVRRAREVFRADEFGFGAFEGGCMLLTHPEREQLWEQLHMDLLGDKFDDPGNDLRFALAPLFGFSDGQLEFGMSGFHGTYERYGSVSGFLPQ